MKFVYSLMLELYPSLSISLAPSSFWFILSILTESIIFTQNIQFFWYKDMELAQWTEHEKIWTALSSPALITISSSLGFTSVLTSAVLLVLYFLLVLLTLISALKYLRRKVGTILKFLTKICLHLVCKVFFIPTVLILLELNRAEGSNKINLNSEFSDYSQIFTYFALALVLFLTFFYEVSHYEFRPTSNDTITLNKINANGCLVVKAIEVLNCFFATFFKTSYHEVFLIACLLSYGLSSWIMIRNLPFYSRYINLCKSFFQLSLASIALFFLVGLWNDNSLLILILTVLMQPVIIIATYALIKRRYSKAQNQKFPEKKNFSLFQIFIRTKLQSTHDPSILQKFGENYLKTQNKQNIIQSAYYCQDTLENYSLALNKIFSINHKGLNLPLSYQIYKSKEFMKEHSKKFSRAHKIYKFIKSLLEIRSKDKKFTELWQRFIIELLKVPLNITVVKKLISKVITKLNNLEKKYIKILDKFPNSNEARKMYLTLLFKIKRDNEKGQMMLDKNGNVGLNPRINQNLLLTESLLMFSGDQDSFGKLKFISRDLMKKLKYSKESEADLELSSFFPKVFYDVLKSNLLKFFSKLNETTDFQDLMVHLRDNSGFLHECKLSIWCIIIENQRGFIFSVVNINKNREYALISNKGIIDSHSKSFTSMLGLKTSYLNGTFIKESVSNIDFNHLLLYKYDEIYPRAQESTIAITVQLKQFKFFNQTFYGLYLSQELISCEWDSEEVSEFFNINPNLNSIAFDEEVDSINELPINEKTVLQREILIENKSKSIESNSLDLLSKNEQKLYERSMLLMKTTKAILLILILLLTSSNIAIMANIKNEVTRALDSKVLVNLNYLSFALAKVSLITRSMDIYDFIGENQYYSEKDFLDSIQVLLNYQEPIFDDLSLWEYCKSSEIVNENKLGYWEFNGTPKVKYTDLYGFVNFILENAETVFYKLNKGESYKNEMMNLIYNAQGETLLKILDKIDDLIVCETDRINELETQRIYLLMSGVIVTALSGLIITIYLLCSDKYINSLWEALRNRTYSQAASLNEVLIERFKKYHDYKKIEEFHFEDSTKSLRFMHSLRFIGKLSFLFAFAFIFLFLTSLYFYSHVKDYLYYRPLMIGYFSRRQVQLIRMSYTILESYAIERNYSIEEYYSECIPINPVKLEFELIYSDINKNKVFLFDPIKRELLSPELWDLIFDKVNNVSTFIQAGTHVAIDYLGQESYYNINDKASKNFEDLNDLFGKMNEFIANVQGNIVQLVIDHTKSKIQTEMIEMILFVVCCCLFLLLTYFLYYLPIVQNEIKVLNNVVNILKIMTKAK